MQNLSTTLPIATRTPVLPRTVRTIIVQLDRPLKIRRFEIEGEASEWIINDVVIDGISQFVQSGDVPGDMFAVNALEDFVKFSPGTRIELFVTYLGYTESGCCFSARFLGSVEPGHLELPPATVRATVRVSGEALEKEVIAPCN